MNTSKFFCVLIAGLAIIGFTSIGMASEESKQSETSEATASEVMAEGENATIEESSDEIEYGAKIELGLEEGEAKAEKEEAKAE